MTVVLVCGDRHWAADFSFLSGPTAEGAEDFNFMMKILANFNEMHDITKLYQGGQFGGDQCAKYWAWISGTPMKENKADWDKYGKRAGPIRNQKQLDQMLKWMRKTRETGHVLAFHRKYESESRGSKDMVRRAIKAGVPVTILPLDHE